MAAMVLMRATQGGWPSLWSSGDQITSWNHFSGISVANGRVYIGTYDGKLYAFGIDRSAGTK